MCMREKRKDEVLVNSKEVKGAWKGHFDLAIVSKMGMEIRWLCRDIDRGEERNMPS